MLVQGKAANIETQESSSFIEKKVKNEKKAQELEKMEVALKQATLEAHKQREALSSSNSEVIKNKHLFKLQQKQNQE